MNRPILITLLLYVITVNTAWAQASLQFRAPENVKEKRLIQYIQKDIQSTDIEYFLAAVDLNYDLINEYILKPASQEDCSDNRLCPFYIIALQERTPVTIGKFNAHKIAVSNKKTYGVRNIIVYNDGYNDFKTKIAVWHPYELRYK